MKKTIFLLFLLFLYLVFNQIQAFTGEQVSNLNTISLASEDFYIVSFY